MVDTTYSEVIGDDRPDGTLLGKNPAALVAFHGATPVVQASSIASVSTAAVTTAAGFYGFATAAQGNSVISTLNSILTVLSNKGLMASS